MGTSRIIMRRSVNLSKTYLLIAGFMAVLAIGFSAIPHFASGMGAGEIPIDVESYFSFFFIAFGAMTAVLIATPVMLLFVYDKNNGVLEYLLSTGMTQSGIFRGYLQASLALAAMLLAVLALGNAALTLLLGGNVALLPVKAALMFMMGISVVAFTAVLMMAFSSLQKQRVGANQPLGIGIGVFLVMPSYLLPAIFPEIGLTIVALNAIIGAGLGLAAFVLSGRLIKREKLLP